MKPAVTMVLEGVSRGDALLAFITRNTGTLAPDLSYPIPKASFHKEVKTGIYHWKDRWVVEPVDVFSKQGL